MRIFTSLIAMCLAVLVAGAQDVVVKTGDYTIPNGQTIKVGYTKSGTSKKVRYVWDPEMKLSIPVEGSVTITLSGDPDSGIGVTLDNGVSDNVQCCAPDAQCENMADGFLMKSTKPGFPLAANTLTSMLIERVYTGPVAAVNVDDIKDYTIEVTVMAEGANPFSCIVEFVAAPAEEVGGVQSPVADEQFVNVSADSSLRYNVAAETILNVFDNSGAQVYSATVKGKGRVSLSHLAPGIYIYSAGNYSGKIAVK